MSIKTKRLALRGFAAMFTIFSLVEALGTSYLVGGLCIGYVLYVVGFIDCAMGDDEVKP